MKTGYIVILIAALFMPANLFAYTYLGAVEGVGDPVVSVTADTLAMGNTSIASVNGAEAVFYNPSNMLRDNRGSLSLGFGAAPMKETIENSDFTNYSSANYFQFSGFAGVYPVSPQMRIGIGYRPVFDFNYEHDRKVYSGGIQKASYDFLRQGSLNTTSISFAAQILPQLNLGLNFNILNGGYEGSSKDIAVESTKTEYDSNSDLSGSSFKVGLNWEVVREKFTAGLTWQPGYKVKSSWSSSVSTYMWTGNAFASSPSSESETEGEIKYSYPAETGIGFRYEFFEKEISAITFDFVVTNWSNFSYKEKKDTTSSAYDKNYDPKYRDTTRISLGIEHLIGRSTLLRYGFTHMPHYSRTSADLTMFTAGVGFPVTNTLNMNIGGAYGKRTFYGENVYFTEDEMVDERVANLLVSVKWMY